MTEESISSCVVCSAGDDGLSKVLNAAIGFKPLFAVMKVMAKNTMKNTAEKNGISWDGTVRDYEQADTKQQLVQIKDEIEDKAMEYPEYYVQQFHGYTEGNLNWLVRTPRLLPHPEVIHHIDCCTIASQ